MTAQRGAGREERPEKDRAQHAEQPVAGDGRGTRAAARGGARGRRRRHAAGGRWPEPRSPTATNAAIAPNAPSAIDSGRIASSSWATTGGVRWNSYCAPEGITPMSARSTAATSPEGFRSWMPYRVGEIVAGATTVASWSSAGVNTTKPYAASMSSWITWLLKSTMATTVHIRAQFRRCGVTREEADREDFAHVCMELPGGTGRQHRFVGFRRISHPTVHHRDPVLGEQLAVGAREHEVGRRRGRVGLTLRVDERDLKHVDAVDMLHARHAHDLRRQRWDRRAVLAERRDGEVGRIGAREKFRVRRLGPARGFQRSQRDAARQRDQHRRSRPGRPTDARTWPGTGTARCAAPPSRACGA